MTGPRKHTDQTPFTSGGMTGRLGICDCHASCTSAAHFPSYLPIDSVWLAANPPFQFHLHLQKQTIRGVCVDNMQI